MTDFSRIASEIFTTLQTYNYTMMLFDDDGQRVTEPADARRFVDPKKNIAIALVDEEDNSAVRLFIGAGTDINSVTGLCDTLRTSAQEKYNLLFNIREHGKEIEPKDFATAQAVTERAEQMAERIISETRAFLREAAPAGHNGGPAPITLVFSGKTALGRKIAKVYKIMHGDKFLGTAYATHTAPKPGSGGGTRFEASLRGKEFSGSRARLLAWIEKLVSDDI